jgi:hypothetical protein
MRSTVTPWLVMVVAAAVGGVLSLAVSDWVTRLWNVSDMEGGRALLVIFFFTPLGLLFGAGVGYISSASSAGSPPLRPLILAVLITTAGVVVTGGIAVGIRGIPDQPPLTHGPRVLDLQLRFAPGTTVESLRARDTRADLRVSFKGRRDVFLNFDGASVSDEGLVIPARALMRRQSDGYYWVVVHNVDTTWPQIDFRFHRDPGPGGTGWSDWSAGDYAEPGVAEALALRWRLRAAGER